jgi:uncharacterized protein with von Willebrand factor type A (vWA) domain
MTTKAKRERKKLNRIRKLEREDINRAIQEAADFAEREMTATPTEHGAAMQALAATKRMRKRAAKDA